MYKILNNLVQHNSIKLLVKKILLKNIQYNILSLLNVVVAFSFILLLGRHFGMSTDTDIYFFSIVVATYLGFLVQASWEAMRPYYIKLKIENIKSSHKLYSVLLNGIIILSLIIIGIYFLITNNIALLTLEQKTFLDIFIFSIIFQNILLLNKMTLNLEEYYASFYLVDIFIYSVNTITVIFFLTSNLTLIAYSTLFAIFIANIWQFYLIFKKKSFKYYFIFYQFGIKEIYKNSIKIKIGSLLYGAKEPLLATVFLSFGEGLYSLYSYANKFASALFQITNGPIMNIYITKLNTLVAHNNYTHLNALVKTVLSKTLLLYTIAVISFYIIMPYFLNFFFANKLAIEDFQVIKLIYIYVSIFYFIVAIEAPFARSFDAFKLFNYALIINGIFFMFVLLLYFLFRISDIGYQTYLTVLIFAQISNLLIYVYKNKLYIKSKIVKYV